MRDLRTCGKKLFNSGYSACQIDFEKLRGALLVEHGKKLPKELTVSVLEELCHASRPDRIYPIMTFVEYAKNGGEPQTGNVGYGGTTVTGVSPRTDTLTLNKCYDHLNARLLKVMSVAFDVYFWDHNCVLYGLNDGTDILAGIPMSAVYPTIIPHPTGSAKASLTVSFCYDDPQDAMENFDYKKLDYNPKSVVIGLEEVKLEKLTTGDTKFKLFERIGGYDRTAEFGQLIADKAAEVMNNVTSATYSEEDDVITIVPKDAGTPSLKAPSILFTNGIKGIEQV